MQDRLTNACLTQLFKSNFELAEYAIALATYWIRSGRETTLQIVLNQLLEHPDPSYLEELKFSDSFGEEEGESNAEESHVST